MRRTAIYFAGAVAMAASLNACGSDSPQTSAAKDCTPVASALTVGGLDSLKFDATSYETGAGCIEFTYVNEGSVAHTLLVEGQPFELAIGKTDVGTLALERGTYTLYCDVAGHRAAGMEATLTVNAAAVASG
ncbi:MAG: hypothetical protein WD691_12185 [Acidimicrobiales bacterium]